MLPPYFIPKSPTVSTLPRFDSQQLVHLPTGGSQLSVPVAELQAGSLHLPVTLAYAYTGLRVYQPREMVGLGWMLQVGASITRQVSGLVDEAVVSNPDKRYNQDSVAAGVNSQRYLKRAFKNQVDTSPDLYSFSLPGGQSGRFVIVDTTIRLFPRQPVRIRRLPVAAVTGYGPGFQIATEDGIRYQFQTTEVTTPNPNNFESIGQHASAWHLTRVISADNADTLRLYYSTSGAEAQPLQCSVTTGRYYTGTYEDNGNAVLIDPASACGSTAAYSFTNARAYPSHIQSWYLDSVTTRGARLLVKRHDVSPTHEVENIRLLATVGGRREIKRVTFYQSHFDGGTSQDYHLRLDSLVESAGGLRLPAYLFTYAADNPLPLRGSAALDYWGYANGAVANGDYNTTTNATLLADPLLEQGTQHPANRMPNFAFAQLGALRHVRYPTGGSSQWDYELGRLDNGDTIPIDTVVTEIGPIGYSAATAQVIPNTNGKRVTSSPKETFRVQFATSVRVYLTRQPWDTAHANGGSNQYRDFDIWRRWPTGDSLITLTEYKSTDPAKGRSFTFQLPAGQYVAQTYCEMKEANTGLMIFVPHQDSSQVQMGLPGPGVRVIQTTTLAPGAPPLLRTYDYTLNGYPTGTSLLPDNGMGFDAYLSTNQSGSGGQGATTGTLCYFINTSSNNRGLGNDFNKYDFYYAGITEHLGMDQGATRHTFTHHAQQFNDVVPVQQLTYRQSLTGPQLTQATTYSYWNDSLFVYHLVKSRAIATHTGGTAVVSNEDIYEAKQYELLAGFVAPQLTTQVRYDEQGRTDTILTRQYYRQQRVVRSATRTSTGWRIQRYKRLSDYAPTDTVTALRVNNFNPLIETQTWQRPLTGPDSALVAGQLTFYDPRWRSPARTYRLRLAQPLPGLNRETLVAGRYAHLLSDTRYELLASVRYAATCDDLLEQRPAHGLPTSYLTGYAHTLLLAEAKNAPYAQVAYTSFEPEATGRWRYDSLGTHRQPGGRTGRWAYQWDGTNAGKIDRYGLPAGDYELTFWAKGGLPTLTVLGGTVVTANQLLTTGPDGWQQYRNRLHLPAAGYVSLNGLTGLLDELRLCPVGAQLTSYTHEPLVGETSVTGPDGRTTTYEYDALGRLVRTRDEQGRILGQQHYHYAGH